MSEGKAQQWRGQPGGPGYQPPGASARNKKAFLLAAFMLALGGAAAAWLLYVRPMTTPYCVSLPIREYAAPELPTNALVVQDSDLLLQHFPADKRQKAYESQTRDRIRLELQKIQQRGAGPVVIHLCALARGPADAKEDDVYLFPGDADPGDSRSWLSLRDVLKSLRDFSSPHKLLILDVMRPLADPRLGVLTDDVGTRVQDVLKKENLAGLLVLCACDRGQLSLVSENWKQSVFAYYLDQGLRGPADGLGPRGRENRRVSVTELAAFVQDRVDRWAKIQRGVGQKPVLLGDGEDFALNQLDESEPDASPKWQEMPFPPWIKAGWETRDRWWDDGSFRLAPRLFREMETILIRAEERWLGGVEETRLKNELKSDLDQLEGQRKKARELPTCQPISLAVMPEKNKPADPALELALREMMMPAKLLEMLGKPGDLEKARAPFKEKFKALTFVPMAWTTLELARKLPSPSPAQVLILDEMLRAVHPDGRTIETMFLQRLVELAKRVKDNEWTWPSAEVKQALAAMHQAELAIAGLSEAPVFLPLLAPVFMQAEDLRRQGDKALFTGRPPDWEPAARQSRQAELLYSEILKRLDHLLKARRDLDEATVILPGLVPFLVNLPDVDQQELARWNSAIQAAKKLGDRLLTAEPDPGLGGEELDQHLELRQSLGGLKRFFSARAQRFQERAGKGSSRDYLDFLALRSSPRLSAGQRETLWKTGQGLAYRLQQAVDDPATPVPALAPDQEPRRKSQRAALSIDLLRLASFTGVDELQQQMEKAIGLELAEGLRDAWARKLPAQIQTAESNLPRADRLSRMLPVVHGKAADPAHWSYSPATVLARSQAQAFMTWLGQRYRAESAVFAKGSASASFFARAADDCLR